MEKSKKIITLFNKQLSEFIEQLMNVFPLKKNNEAMKIYIKFQTTLTLTPQIIINLFFHEIVDGHFDEIKNRDEHFFTQLFKSKTQTPFKVFLIVYKDATEENKKIIWDYIQRLGLLCSQYFQEIELSKLSKLSKLSTLEI